MMGALNMHVASGVVLRECLIVVVVCFEGGNKNLKVDK
jgi:hypothetical protein